MREEEEKVMKIASGVMGASRVGGTSTPFLIQHELVKVPKHGPCSGGADAEMELGVQQDAYQGMLWASILGKGRWRERKT